MTSLSKSLLGQLSERFVDLTFISSPGTAVRWGYDLREPVPLSANAINVVLTQLMQLEYTLTHFHEMDKEAMMLLESVRASRFEWANLTSWRLRSAFYIICQINTMIAGLKERVEDGKPDEWVARWIRSIPDQVDSAVYHVLLHGVSRLSSVYVLHILKTIESDLTVLVQHYCIPAKDLNAVMEANRRLREALVQRGAYSAPLTAPIGAEMLSEWVQVHSGIRFDAKRLSDQCVEYIALHRKQIYEAVLGDDSATAPLDLSVPRVRALCEQIVVRLRSWFEIDDDILSGLAFKMLLGAESHSSSRAAYRSIGYVTGPPTATLIWTPSAYHNQVQIEVDLVHEVYPGHHWERTRFYQEHTGKVGCLVHESRPYTEGWAKYCESFYAQVAFNPTVTHRANAEQGVVALTALAAARIHTAGTTLERLAHELLSLTGLPANHVRSLLLNAYLHPIDAVAPFLGLQATRCILGDSPTREQLSCFVKMGPLALKGVSL